MTTASQGLINQLTYGVGLTTTADDETIIRVADALIEQRIYLHPVPEYHHAIVTALDSTDEVAPEYGDERITRDFLTRLLRLLDERRPWPDPPFVAMEVSSWPALAAAPVVGYIPSRRRELEARLNRSFADIEENGTRSKVMVLRLRTGQVIALRMAAEARQPGAAVLTADDPATTVADLRELTEVPVEPCP